MQLRSASVRPVCGMPGEVDPKAIRRAQAWALAQDDDGQFRFEEFADMVADGDAALLDDPDRELWSGAISLSKGTAWR